MAQKWDLSNPMHAEQALEYLYSLPDEDTESDVEADDGAKEELAAIESTAASIVESIVSYSQEDDVQMPPPPPADHTNEESYEKLDWGYKTDYFTTITDNFRQNAVVNSVLLGEANKPVDYFHALFDGDIIDNIVVETNRYAAQKQSKNWKDTTNEEIRAFIGMHIIMGIHQLPHLENYWSTDPILGVESVSQVMTTKRYKKIVENIHANNNESNTDRNDANHDKLHKLRPIIDRLNEKFAELINPSSYLSIDESMIPFKGRSSLKQYMPMKPVKRGYKVWCLADSTMGYIIKFEVYTGKSNVRNVDNNTLGERVVMNLSEAMRNKNCILAYDNFFSSPKLSLQLNSNGIYSCGTVRTNRKNLPAFMKTNDKLVRGEFQFQTSGPLAAVRWMDNKPVTFLSTIHNPRDTTTVLRKNKRGQKDNVSCPIVVAAYNTMMGGVDRFDQFRERYAIGRRSVKWWHRIFYYLVDLAIVNGYLLYKQNKRTPQDQLTFRISLAKQLIGNFSSRKRRGRPASFLAKRCLVPVDVRLAGVGKHLPELGGTYRRCRCCSTKAVEKRTKYMCTACRVPLCVDPCFRMFHS